MKYRLEFTSRKESHRVTLQFDEQFKPVLNSEHKMGAAVGVQCHVKTIIENYNVTHELPAGYSVKEETGVIVLLFPHRSAIKEGYKFPKEKDLKQEVIWNERKPKQTESRVKSAVKASARTLQKVTSGTFTGVDKSGNVTFKLRSGADKASPDHSKKIKKTERGKRRALLASTSVVAKIDPQATESNKKKKKEKDENCYYLDAVNAVFNRQGQQNNNNGDDLKSSVESASTVKQKRNFLTTVVRSTQTTTGDLAIGGSLTCTYRSQSGEHDEYDTELGDKDTVFTTYEEDGTQKLNESSNRSVRHSPGGAKSIGDASKHSKRNYRVSVEDLNRVPRALNGKATEKDFKALSSEEQTYDFKVVYQSFEKENHNQGDILVINYRFNDHGKLLEEQGIRQLPLSENLCKHFKAMVLALQAGNMEELDRLKTIMNITSMGGNKYRLKVVQPVVSHSVMDNKTRRAHTTGKLTEQERLVIPYKESPPWFKKNEDSPIKVLHVNQFSIYLRVLDALFFGGWLIDKITQIERRREEANIDADPYGTLKERLSYYDHLDGNYQNAQAYRRAKRIRQFSRFMWFASLTFTISFIVFSALTFAYVIAPPFAFMIGIQGGVGWLVGSIIIVTLAFPMVALALGRGLGEAFHFIRAHAPGVWWDDNNAHLLHDVTCLGLIVGIITAILFSVGFGLVAGGVAPAVAGIGVVAAVTSIFGSGLIAGIFATIFISSVLIVTSVILGFGLGALLMQAAKRIPTGKNHYDEAIQCFDGDIQPGEAISLQYRYNRLRENVMVHYKDSVWIGVAIGGLIGLIVVGLLIDFAPVFVAMRFVFWGPVLIGTPLVLMSMGIGALAGILLAKYSDPESILVLDQLNTPDTTNSTGETTALLNQYQSQAEQIYTGEAISEQIFDSSCWQNFINKLNCSKPIAKEEDVDEAYAEPGLQQPGYDDDYVIFDISE